MIKQLPHTTESTVSFKLSFRPFINYLKNQQKSCQAINRLGDMFDYMTDQFTPTFGVEPLEDLYDKDQLAMLFQMATVTVFPLAHTNREVSYAFGLPFPLTLFHHSDEFGRLMTEFPGLLSEIKTQISAEDQQRFMYRLILEKFYGVQSFSKKPPSFRFQQSIDGLTKYYRIDINTTFIEPRLDGPRLDGPRLDCSGLVNPGLAKKLPALQSAWIDYAKGGRQPNGRTNPLPLSEFTFEGFAYFVIEDITEAETVQQLQAVFSRLHSDTEPEIYRRFETALRNLVGQPELQLSIVPFQQVNGYFVHQDEMSSRSVFLRHSGQVVDGYKDPFAQKTIHELIKNPVPRLFPDLKGLPEVGQKMLHQNGFRSFLWYPIVNGEEALGILEMASPQPNAFDEGLLPKIEQVIPLVQELLRYQLRQFNQNLEQLIKQKFTSLQPSVEWKFNEVAWEYLRLGKKESFNSHATQVRFPQVYPIYGAVDIRNSSNERYKAVRQDFSDQLAAVQKLLKKADLPDELLVPDQLIATAAVWQNKLTEELNSEDELSITDFLTQEVKPYFQHLLGHYPELETAIQPYFKQTNSANGQFNRALQIYERSVEWLNTAVNTFIENEEKRLQAIYPHYFERYRTDGMEYTLYVGQSISPQKSFEPNYLRQLYQWQLTSMVDMARLTNLLLPRLPLPLQTTQLILVNGQPVDISFRQDEHRFDVEGSYSIRYEVLKKRIDKALIAGTQERLTQPDTIALVYTNTREIADYLPFITQLQEQKKVAPDVEYLDLEPLQGVAKLKALRLHLLYPTEC